MNSARSAGRSKANTNDMLRDLTMIFSVLVSVISLMFGVYKNIEASNARGFAYEQAYRVMNIVRDASIGPATKANILSASLAALGTPPPVIDLSRSSADVLSEPEACSPDVRDACIANAGQLAEANARCAKAGPGSGACSEADALQTELDIESCISCFQY